MLTKTFLWTIVAASALFAADDVRYDYRVLATSKTSTMQKEMNDAADAGYVFRGVMGGETGFGGKEVLVVMAKDLSSKPAQARKYMLLATSKTSTMQKEVQQAGDEGFEYMGQTIFESAFGGKEVAVILERNKDTPVKRFEYKVLSTSKTSTMEKQLKEAGAGGFEFLGVTIGETAFGGNEVISLLRRTKP